MAVTYNTTVKNARLQVVIDAIDAGTGAGKLEIMSAGGTVLATVPLADPCGTVSAGVLTFTMPQSDSSADATGTATQARIRDSDNTDVVTGLTVGVGSEDIVLDSASITAGQVVTINTATITHG